MHTIDDAAAAARAGSDRLELCVDLESGGITPPESLIAAVRERVAIPVFVMVRPRAGDFVYDDDEFTTALRQAAAARTRGAHGIVTGVLRRDGFIDVERTRLLVQAAGDLPVTFHRAFDAVPHQPATALEDIITAGIQRVLTSGAAATALEGAGRLASLVRQAGDRITVLAGGGVRADNVRQVIARSGVTEIHARFENEAATRALADLL